MAGILDQFRKKVISSVWRDNPVDIKPRDIDDKIALGVLLWIVAEADEKFLPQEAEKIKEILATYGRLSESEMPYVMNSIEEAAKERIDLYQFTHEVSKDLPHDVKVKIIEDLFRVACADKDLDNNEVEVIRKISNLFRLTHKDFIDTKIRIKSECGLET
ncbi:MAG: TerB family tellurite resistance protein [Candidatus Omnitrophota bacterium]|nr:MAG: TerB family tellurite resistance protein [Candidatus Omnitrophota bacterium]